MEPVPQTVEVLRALAEAGESELGTELWDMAKRTRQIVPELVGFSLGMVQDQVTLTLVASAEQLAGLDAIQYADDGPCVTAIEESEAIQVAADDLLDEGRWLAYAQATAALGIASSLSMPIMADGRVVGGVNLYASSADAFDGRLEELAAAVGSSAEHAIRNADLSFRTLQQATEAPQRVREGRDIDIAVGIIAESRQVDTTKARQLLRDAAARAGITEGQAAMAFRYVRGR